MRSAALTAFQAKSCAKVGEGIIATKIVVLTMNVTTASERLTIGKYVFEFNTRISPS